MIIILICLTLQSSGAFLIHHHRNEREVIAMFPSTNKNNFNYTSVFETLKSSTRYKIYDKYFVTTYNTNHTYPGYIMYGIRDAKEALFTLLEVILGERRDEQNFYNEYSLSRKYYALFSYLEDKITKLIGSCLTPYGIVILDYNVKNYDKPPNKAHTPLTCSAYTKIEVLLTNLITKYRWKNIAIFYLYRKYDSHYFNVTFKILIEIPDICVHFYKVSIHDLSKIIATFVTIKNKQDQTIIYIVFGNDIYMEERSIFLQYGYRYNIQSRTIIMNVESTIKELYHQAVSLGSVANLYNGLILLSDSFAIMKASAAYFDTSNTLVYHFLSNILAEGEFYQTHYPEYYLIRILCGVRSPYLITETIRQDTVTTAGFVYPYLNQTLYFFNKEDPTWSGNNYNTPVSYCNKTKCNVGKEPKKTLNYINNIISYEWSCELCKKDFFKPGNERQTCQKCKDSLVSNKARTICYDPFKDVIFEVNITNTIVFIIMSAGIVGTVFVILTFIKFKSTPVILSSNFQLSMIQLISHGCLFFIIPSLILKTTNSICKLRHIFIGFCYVTISIVIFVKSKKLVFIFTSKTMLTKKQKIIAAVTDFLSLFSLLTVQISIGCVTTLFRTSRLIENKNLETLERKFSCSTDINLFIQLVIIIGISFVCIANGLRARNLPACYNETQYIAFAMMTSNLALLVIFPLYYSANNYQDKSSILTLCLLLGNLVIFTIMFSYKIYVIYFDTSKNTTSFYRSQMSLYALNKTDNEINKKKSVP